MMSSVSGTILLVQENRFQLTSDSDQEQLFILSPHASASGADLQAWKRSRRRVTVRYEPAENLIAMVARSVTPRESSAGPKRA